MFRFSLRRMLVVFTVVAVGIASLLRANALLSGIWGLVTNAVILAALLAALLDRGRRRNFAIGFFLIAAIYSVNARLGSAVMLKLFDQPAYALGTAPILDAAFSHLVRVEYSVQGSDEWSSTKPTRRSAGMMGGIFETRTNPESWAFRRIGFDMFTLLFGYAGGMFAVFLYDRRHREVDSAC